MSGSIAKRKIVDIIDKIYNTVHQSGGATIEDFAPFEAEAYQLRISNIGEGDILLGILAGFKGDVDEVRKRFNNARAYLGNSYNVICNYGIALYNAGHFSETISVLLDVADKDAYAAEIMSKACLALGLRSKARQYYIMAGHSLEEFEVFSSERDFPVSKLKKEALADLEESLVKDRALWERLSKL